MANSSRTLNYHLNRVAGLLVNDQPTRDEAGAANIWAGTTDLETVGALNVKAANALDAYRDLAGVLNQLAGTTGLEVDEAASFLV